MTMLLKLDLVVQSSEKQAKDPDTQKELSEYIKVLTKLVLAKEHVQILVDFRTKFKPPKRHPKVIFLEFLVARQATGNFVHLY